MSASRHRWKSTGVCKRNSQLTLFALILEPLFCSVFVGMWAFWGWRVRKSNISDMGLDENGHGQPVIAPL